MKRILRILAALAIALTALNAQARVYNQAELDALLAPIALYPDPVLNNIIDAAQYPDEVMDAAGWSRANPQLQGDTAVAAVQDEDWAPSVKALVAYPDVLARLAESPQWLADLGDAYATHGPYLQTTIQELRARAQASGYLQSDANQQVYQQGPDIVVQPVYPNVVYVPYYNPYVVYGSWWWPAYRPVVFRPFHPRPVFVTRIVQPVRVVHPVRVVREPRFTVTPYHAVPESRRMPIIQSAPRVAPAVTQPAFKHFPPFAQSSHFSRAPVTHAAPVVRSAPVAQAPHASQAPVARLQSSGGGSGGGFRWNHKG
jgi:hypothetical protein